MKKEIDIVLSKIINILLVVILLLIGAVFGAQYADNNWKNDILKVSYAENKTLLAFEYNNLNYYFFVKHMTMDNYYDYININQSDLVTNDT